MAVEAPPHNMNLFPSQLLTSSAAMPILPSSTALPFYHQSDSGLTCHATTAAAPPRKRSRDSITTTESNTLLLPVPQKNKLSSSPPSILDQDLLFHFQNQQSEIDRFIAQHTEKVRMELEEQRVRHGDSRSRGEETEGEGRGDSARGEAELGSAGTKQVLAHVSEDHHHNLHHTTVEACASNNNNNNHPHREEEEVCGGSGNGKQSDGVLGKRMCNQCGVRESIVLLLPCRHLCLCTMCESTVRNCPLCQSGINASVHVNYS
ncbi:Baculoviral IAP repeat-containing protein 7-A [Glycine soja]|nr:Baculoviral IAP repeat-containing protein 7-A [Glycine soja]